MKPGNYSFILLDETSWNYYSFYYPDDRIFSKYFYKLLFDENNESCKKSRFNKCLERVYAKEWLNWRTTTGETRWHFKIR